MLVAAAREIGGAQIQNRGTHRRQRRQRVAGRRHAAGPRGGRRRGRRGERGGERRVPFVEFYTGYRRSVLAANELIIRGRDSAGPGRQWFRKVGTRAAQAISKVVMAGVDGRWRSAANRHRQRRARRSSGCRAPKPRSPGASIADAQRILLDEIAPIDDVRSTAEYRRRVAANLLASFWNEPPSQVE